MSNLDAVLKAARPEQLQMAQAQLRASQQQATPVRKSNSLLSLIPSALAAGASFIPGIGTAAAAGIGGIGEGARQLLSGEGLNAGKIATEAGLSAIPGGLGKAGKLLKFAKGGAETAEAASKGGSLLSKIRSGGADLQGAARGIKPGATATGQEQLGVGMAEELNGFLNQVGVRSGSAKAQLGQLEQMHKGWRSSLNEALDAKNTRLTATSITGVKNRILSNLTDIAHLPNGGVDEKLVSTYMDKLGKVKDTKGLQNLKNDIDKGINYRRSAQSPDPLHEEISGAFRTGIRDSISEMVPETAGLNQVLAQSHDAQTFLKNAAKNPKGFNLFGQNVGGTTLQSAKSKVGGVVAGSADLAAPTVPGGASLLQFGKELAKQGAVRGGATAAGIDLGAPNVPADPNAAEDPVAPDLSSIVPTSSPGESNVFSPQMLQQLAVNDIATTGGKNLDKIATLDKLFGAGAASKAKKLSAEANKQVANAQSGLSAIGDLATMLSKDSNLPLKDLAPGSVGKGVTGAGEYDAAKQEVIDVLARLRTGAAISKQEETRFKAMLPQVGDSQDTVAAKLNRYQTLFQQILSNQQQGSPDLELAGAITQ